MTLTQIPEGWTTRQTRFLWAAVNPGGKEVLFGLNDEAVRKAIYCLPEYGGVAYAHTVSAHVDL